MKNVLEKMRNEQKILSEMTPEQRFVYKTKQDEDWFYPIADVLTPLMEKVEPDRSYDEIYEKLKQGLTVQAPENAVELVKEILLKGIDHGEILKSLSIARETGLLVDEIKEAAANKFTILANQTPTEKIEDLRSLYDDLTSSYRLKINNPIFVDQLKANSIRDKLYDPKFLKSGEVIPYIAWLDISKSFRENQPTLFSRIHNLVIKELNDIYLPELKKDRYYRKSLSPLMKNLQRLVDLGVLSYEEDEEILEKFTG